MPIDNLIIRFYDTHMEKMITVTEAQRNFSDLINRTYYQGESTLLTRGGKIMARIVPVKKVSPTGYELAEMWDSMAHLSKENADELASDLEEARSLLYVPKSPWES